MKKLKYIIVSAILAGTFSCSDEFLNREPLSFLSDGNVYQSEKDFTATITGLYNTLFNPIYNSQGLFYYNEARSDNTFMSGANVFEPTSEFENLSLVGFPRNIVNWNGMFEMISRANHAIRDLESFGPNFLEQEQLNRLKAEAMTIRALAYFEGIRFWGSLPFITSVQTPEEAYNNTRTPLSAIWPALEADLQEAIAALPSKTGLASTEQGRLTKEAAQMLLAHVYMYQGKKTEAVPFLQEIVSSSNYTLDNTGNGVLSPEDFAALWAFGTRYAPESIFEISFCPEPAEAPESSFCNGAMDPDRLNDFRYTQEAYDSFEADDARRDITFVKGTEYPFTEPGNTDFYYQVKYLWNEGECFGDDCSRNLIIYRFADALLLLTEATGDPQYANMVRERAGLAPKASFTLDEVIQERNAEFIYEADRYNTLVRTGKAVETLNEKKDIINLSPTFRPEFLQWPIPQDALDRNINLTQNDGYNL
jgi:hypothetical protein